MLYRIRNAMRNVQARVLYASMSRQIDFLMRRNRMKEARRVSRNRRRLGQVLFDR